MSFLSKLFHVAAPIAISMIPGIGPVAAAGLGAASGLVGGGGWKGALEGGVGAGVGNYISGAGGLGSALTKATSGTPFADIGSSIGSGFSSVGNGLSSILGTVAGSPMSGGFSGPTQGSGILGSLGGIGSGLGSLFGSGSSSGAASGGGGLGSLFSNPSSILSAGANLYSGIQGTQAAKDMANAQLSSTNAALAQQAKQYGQTQANLNPFLTTGQSANSMLGGLLGLNGASGAIGQPDQASALANLEQTPGYQFQLGQGTKAMNQTLGARGNLFSGDALKAAQSFGQGLAQTTYNDALKNYQGVSQQGQNAAVGLGGFGQGYANSSSGLLTDQGNIQANRINNGNNAVNQSLANILGSNVGGFYGGAPQYDIYGRPVRQSAYGGA